MLKALGHRVQRIYERKSGVLSKRSRKKSSRGYCWRGIFPGKVNSLAKGGVVGAGFEKPAQQIELVNRGQLLSPTWRGGAPGMGDSDGLRHRSLVGSRGLSTGAGEARHK